MRDSFQRKPYLRDNILEEHYDKLMYIETKINEKLADFENFDGIDFCDVRAGGIQIRGFHKEIKGYTYGDQITIKYDFSNYEKVVDEFVNMWKNQDTPEKVKDYKDFIAAGERWGWD